MKRRFDTLHQPVPSWAILLMMLGLVAAMLVGYININNNTKNVAEIAKTNTIKRAQRDIQFCDVAQFFEDVKPFVPLKYVPKLRSDIDKFIVDINSDKSECNPELTDLKKFPRAVPHPSKSAERPQPQATVTHLIVTPRGFKTIYVSPKPSRKTKSPKPKSIFCGLPKPIPPIGKC